MEILWLVGGFVLLVSESFLPSFEVFCCGVGALLTGILTWLVPGIAGSAAIQVALWLGSSVLTLGVLRKKFSGIFRGKMIESEDEKEIDAGLTAEVTKPIAPETPGRIKMHGTTWEARSYDDTFEVVERALILKKEGMVYYVSKETEL